MLQQNKQTLQASLNHQVSHIPWWYSFYLWLYTWELYIKYTFFGPSDNIDAHKRIYELANPQPRLTDVNYPQLFLRWQHKYLSVRAANFHEHFRWDLWDGGINKNRVESLHQKILQEIQAFRTKMASYVEGASSMLKHTRATNAKTMDEIEFSEVAINVKACFKSALQTLIEEYHEQHSNIWNVYRGEIYNDFTWAKDAFYERFANRESKSAEQPSWPTDVVELNEKLDEMLNKWGEAPLPELNYDNITYLISGCVKEIKAIAKQVKVTCLKYHPDKQAIRSDGLPREEAERIFRHLMWIRGMLYGVTHTFGKNVDKAVKASGIIRDPEELAFWLKERATFSVKRESERALRESERYLIEVERRLEKGKVPAIKNLTERLTLMRYRREEMNKARNMGDTETLKRLEAEDIAHLQEMPILRDLFRHVADAPGPLPAGEQLFTLFISAAQALEKKALQEGDTEILKHFDFEGKESHSDPETTKPELTPHQAQTQGGPS